MAQDNDRLADLLNKEPMVFMDCTGPEILAGFGSSLLLGLVLGFLIGLVMGALIIGIMLGLLLGLGASYFALKYIADARNSFYESWLEEKVFLMKRHINPITPPSFIEKTTRFSRSR
jgi:hypothetical protein